MSRSKIPVNCFLSDFTGQPGVHRKNQLSTFGVILENKEQFQGFDWPGWRGTDVLVDREW